MVKKQIKFVGPDFQTGPPALRAQYCLRRFVHEFFLGIKLQTLFTGGAKLGRFENLGS